jgi:hypothetical protein
MADWRKIEEALREFFDREGPQPKQAIGQGDPLAGEWYIPYGKKRINLSALARELEAVK